MTLQASGAISFSQIRTEYGMSNPVSLSQYYGKPGMQASGAIAMSNFYGKSNITRQPATGDYYARDTTPYYWYGKVDSISGWRIYWNNTAVTFSASSGGTTTVGSHTYYRSGLRLSGGSGGSAYEYYGVYRIGPP